MKPLRKKRKRGIKSLLFAVIPLIVALLVGEAALRVTDFQYESFYDCPDWWTRCDQNPVFIGDPVLFWRLRPNANSDLNPESRYTQLINKAGFRDDDTPIQKQPNELRIITMGDSCTYGDGVANWESYPNVLEKLIRLSAPDRPVSVLNAGVPGYTAYQIDTYLRSELLKYKPDVVTVYVGFNDNIPAAGGIPDKDIKPLHTPGIEALRGILEHFRLYQYANKVITGLKRKTVSTAPPPVSTELDVEQEFRVSTGDYMDILCGINETGKTDGFTTIIMTLPHVFDKEPHRNHNVRVAADRCKIPLLDLWSIMKAEQATGKGLYNADGGHPNAIGHRIIATALMRKLQELGIIKEGPAPELPPIVYDTMEPDQFDGATDGGA